MNQPMMELPKYKSHKVVRALSIAAIEVHEDKSATIAPSLTAYAPFKTQPGWAERFKGNEDDKGYYVVYEDGYASWSPTKAFEEGYTKLRAEDGPLSELKAALKADEDYAWSWLCNLACIGLDAGGRHESANRYAAQFMKNAFDVDVTSHSRWKAFEDQWANQDELAWAARCDTLLTKLQSVIDGRAKRTLEEMQQLSARLHSIASAVSKMELTEIQP